MASQGFFSVNLDFHTGNTASVVSASDQAQIYEYATTVTNAYPPSPSNAVGAISGYYPVYSALTDETVFTGNDQFGRRDI